MAFLKETFRPYTIKWFVQRTVLVLKEGRLPQFAIFSGIKKANEKPVHETKPKIQDQAESKLSPAAAPESMKLESVNNETKSTSDTFPINDLNEEFHVNLLELKISGKEQQEHLINSYFDFIYVLNLKERPEKRLMTAFQLKKLGIHAHFIDAVNGYSAPYYEEYQEYASIPLFQPGAHPLEKKLGRKTITSAGAWGILKSYKMIMLDAISKNYKRILVLEDDIFFIKDFHTCFESFINKVDDDWKILGLGVTQHKWEIPEHLLYHNPEIREYDPGQDFYHPLITDGTFALGYDRSVFQLLIDEIDQMNCSFDSGPVRKIYAEFPQKCFAAQPYLIIADVSTSDIREGRNQEEFSKKVRWDLDLYEMKTDTELVSVIMPAFNAEKTIDKSIRSILIQTYKNLELIVVDDGSTDTTPDIVKNITKEDPRVVYIRNEQNRGCYYVRNDALRIAKGKYIAIQDADDISFRDRIEKQLIPLVSGNACMTFSLFLRSHCTFDELDLNDQEGMRRLVESRRIQVNGKYTYHESHNLALATSIYTRGMFEKYGLFWEYRFGSDIEYVERILYHETGKTFGPADGNAHSFITTVRTMPGVFVLLDELMYISAEMNHDNLTKKYQIHGDERKEFFNMFRNRLEGKFDYNYPVF